MDGCRNPHYPSRNRGSGSWATCSAWMRMHPVSCSIPFRSGLFRHSSGPGTGGSANRRFRPNVWPRNQMIRLNFQNHPFYSLIFDYSIRVLSKFKMVATLIMI